MSEPQVEDVDGSAEAARRVLQDLLWLPGACYSCLIEPVSGEVLADLGTQRSSTAEVVEWAVAVALLPYSSTMGDLQDVMITTRRSYHLVRRVAPVGGRPLLVVLVLDRQASNLAAARRELAAARVSTALAHAILPGQGAAVRHRAASATPPPAAEVVAEPAVAVLPARPALDLPERAASPRAVPEPRRSGPVPAVLRQHWANDVGTMHRLLTGLRSLV